MASMYSLGVDVGGTFTDLVALDEQSGSIWHCKVHSTPHDQSVGVQSGIERILSKLPDRESVAFRTINHGTTVATNTILEQNGAKVALIVTEGYKDILQTRRSHVPGGLAAWITWKMPGPLAPLDLTVETPGRIGIDGKEIRQFDEQVFAQRLKAIVAEKPDAFTVSLLNSFVNSEHEKKALSTIRKQFPNTPISLSCEVQPEIMEYERTITTVANSYLHPRVAGYLEKLWDKVRGRTKCLNVLRSDGGLCSISLACQLPVTLALSGPAGGVAGIAGTIASHTEYKNLITLDMGGTSTDVALIKNGSPTIRRTTTVGDLVVRTPSIDVKTVGAGGGSIVHVPELTKALRVGPQSAGADPGPACYGRGNVKATVTDANLVLGYLPGKILGGEFHLDVDVARDVIQKLADNMSLSLYEMAEGILRVVNETMYGTIRVMTVEQGLDPNVFSLVAFGGAGPMHANALGILLDTFPVIVPPSPGVLSARGAALTRLRLEVSKTFIYVLEKTSSEDIFGAYQTLKAEASEKMSNEQGVSVENHQYTYQADVRYTGQAINITIDVDIPLLKEEGPQHLRQTFERLHEKLYSFRVPSNLELVNLHIIIEEKKTAFPIPLLQAAKSHPPPEAASGSTTIIYQLKEFRDCPMWDRTQLLAGHLLCGPCLITEIDSTTTILPGFAAEIDKYGNILIQRAAGKPDAVDNVPVKGVAKDKPHNEQLDPITVDIFESALRSARFEMDALVTRAAMSPAIREQQDEFPMIAEPGGLMIAGQFGSFIPDFLANWSDSIEPGDVFLTNDPYSVGGAISHLNDWLIMMPIFFEDKMIGWAANFGHMTDNGGDVPGSLPNCASSIFEDGLQIPPTKLVSAGKMNDSVTEILLRNCRMPEWNRCDVMALIAACNTAKKRLLELYNRFGSRTYFLAIKELLHRNHRAVSTLFETAIPKHSVYFEDWIDDDGKGTGPWKIACTMSKQRNGQLKFDFDGTYPQSSSSINFLLSHSMFKMFVGFYLIAVYDPGNLVNDGFHELIDVHVPLGSLLNPIRPAALSCRTHLLGRVLDLIAGLLGQKAPEFMTAGGFSDSPHFMYSGYKESGEWFQLYQIGMGGIPARPHGDGPDGHSLWPAFKSIPNELLELQYPLRIESYKLMTDSGGPGLYRGGNGLKICYHFLDQGEISIHDDRWLSYPCGAVGGMPGGRSRKVLVRDSGGGRKRKVLGSKVDHVRVEEGDLLEWITWGGGGYGDPLKRAPEVVALDVRRGLVSPAGAARYGVFINEDCTVHKPRTERLREKVRKARPPGWENRIFDRGGDMDDIRAKALEETGLEAPRYPWEVLPRGPMSGQKYIQDWFKKHKG